MTDEELQRVKLIIKSAIRDIRSEHFPTTETTNGRWEACPTCFPDTKRWPCAAGGAADDLEALL